MKQKVKKIVSFAVVGCLLSSMSLSIVKAANFFGDYSFTLDYSTGNPYAYSYALDKWTGEDANASSNSYSHYDFTATVLPSYNDYYSNHENIVLYPGDNSNIPVPWYNSRSSQAILRGESNYDIFYEASGFWASDPSYIPHE